MPILDVDGLSFTFPDDWRVIKYDQWSFFHEFGRLKNGIKAVDVLALSPDRTLYLIEVKDYRHRTRERIITVEDEIIDKVVSTLACLVPAKCNDRDPDAAAFASRCVHAQKLKIVLHIEQNAVSSRLFPPIVQRRNMADALQRRFRRIGARATISCIEFGDLVPWSVA